MSNLLPSLARIHYTDAIVRKPGWTQYGMVPTTTLSLSLSLFHRGETSVAVVLTELLFRLTSSIHHGCTGLAEPRRNTRPAQGARSRKRGAFILRRCRVAGPRPTTLCNLPVAMVMARPAWNRREGNGTIGRVRIARVAMAGTREIHRIVPAARCVLRT